MDPRHLKRSKLLYEEQEQLIRTLDALREEPLDKIEFGVLRTSDIAIGPGAATFLSRISSPDFTRKFIELLHSRLNEIVEEARCL